MAEKVTPKKQGIAILKDESAFLQELDWNLERVRKFNHRITVLLIQVEENQDPEPQVPGVVYRLSRILRGTDTIYQVKTGLFAAILMGTHEAGGEAAALRIKRLMMKKDETAGTHSSPLSVYVGVTSIGPEDSFPDPQMVYDVLKKDLSMDRDWEYRNPGSGEVKADSAGNLAGHVVIFASETFNHTDLLNVMTGAGYQCYLARGPEDGIDYLRELKQAVLIMEDALSPDLIKSLCQKLQSNRNLDTIFKICIRTSESKNLCCRDVFDQLLPSNIGKEVLIESVRLGLETSRLRDLDRRNSGFQALMDSLKIASHKLNQPLQIILGKTELILIDIKARKRQVKFLDDLEEIKRQAQKTADINNKIQRLLNNG